MNIAIDFDGTIVEHAYPAIGKEMLFAFDTLKLMQKAGFNLILWTYRTGKELDEAVEYCRRNGIEFYAINKNFPEEVVDENTSRKIIADIYIDDRNIGGFPGWGAIWQMIDPKKPNYESIQKPTNSRDSLFKRTINRIFHNLQS
jgi:hypothetical protein